jgi:hypothetical protein
MARNIAMYFISVVCFLSPLCICPGLGQALGPQEGLGEDLLGFLGLYFRTVVSTAQG